MTGRGPAVRERQRAQAREEEISLLKEAIGTGSTIEEAKEQAVAILGAGPEDNIEIEVLAMPKRKTLGLFGGSPAKVRVSMEVPDPKPAPAKKPATKPQQKPAAKPQAKEEKKPAQHLQREAKPQNSKPAQHKPAPAERPAQPAKPAAAQTTGPAVPAAEVDPNTPAGRAAAYLQNIFRIMELKEVSMTVSPIDGGSQIDLTGQGLGVIIGRRGETLDALQYLASLAANSGEGGFYRLVLNTGNYRQKREQTLQSLARRMAGQVLRTGRNRTLEPMNPYERRIIHTTVQTIEGVVSASIGEGAGRRVVISPDRESGAFEKARAKQRSEAPRGRGSRPGFRNYREENGGEETAQRSRSEIEAFEAKAAGKSVILPENPAPAPAAKPAPKEEPAPAKQDAGDAPLYGRIDKKGE